MLPPKLKHILGCLSFSEKNCVKKNLTPVKSLFKNPFLTLKKMDRNMGILFSNLLSESILDFGKWSNGKYTNMRIYVFSVLPLPEVKIDSESRFEKRMPIFLFFFEEFQSKFKQKKSKKIPDLQ